MMLGWTRTASDIEATSHSHDEAFVSGHAKIQSGDTLRLKVSWPEYSCFFDERNHIADTVVSHESSFTKRRQLYTTTDIS